MALWLCGGPAHDGVARAEQADPFQAHYDRAVRPFLSERYGEALGEFKAAYAASWKAGT